VSRTNIISGFILGVAFRSFFDLGFSFSLLLFFVSLILFISQYFYNNHLRHGVDVKKYVVIFMFITLGTVWYDFRVGESVSYLNGLDGRVISLRVVVFDEPEEKNGKLQAIVMVENDNNSEKILIKTATVPRYKYGDTLQLVGEIKKPENFSEDFDYVSYLAKDDIYFLIENPKVKIISSDKSFSLSRYLFLIKNFFTQNINEVLPEPHSSLLAGLVLGARESLGTEWINKFRIAGLSHIVVLSGYNLTIISDSVMKVISRFLSGSSASFLGAVSIILFTIMTGGGASTVRAAIMALIILLAKTTGRLYEASSALIVAGFLMILHNPRILIFDMSFQLSFLATLGLLYISPMVKKYLTFVTEKLGLREVLATTIGAQIATFPLIAYKMGTFSLVALPVNILVLIFIPITMFLGFLAATLNIINFYIATPVATLAWALLSYILFVVDIFSSLPFASVNVNAINIFLLLLLILMIVIVYKSRQMFSSEIDGWTIEEI